MIRRRIGIHGTSDETLALIPLLLQNPEVEIAGVSDPEPSGLRGRLERLPPEIAEALRGRLRPDAAALGAEPGP